MADAQKTIDLIFNGVDKTGAATLSALNNAKSFSTSLKDATQPIADFTVGAVKLEAALLAGGLAMTVFAVKVAGDFDTAFREIATLISEPIDELGEFRTAIQDYAATSTQPMKDVTQAIYNAISAGVPYAESIAFVTNAEKLAVAGKADLNSATVLLAGSLNAYGLGAESATRFSDALFTTVKQGQTTLPELAASLSMVTSAAATLEIPFETLLAAVATLTSVGMPTAQAVTAINAAMTALIKPSSEATKLAAELGIEFGVQAVKSKGLEVVLADVAKATGGNVEQMAKLFGSSESLKAVLPLVGAAADKFGIDMEAMGKKAGAVQTAFDIMSQSIGNSQQKVINAFEGMLAAVGTPLLDEFGGIANAIAGIFTALGASVKGGALDDLVKYIESQFGSIQQALNTVAKNLPAALASADFSGFKGGIDAVAGAFKLLFNNIDITTVDGLRRAIELAGAAFLGLSKFTAGAIESFKPLFDKLVELGSRIGGLGPDFFKIAGSVGGVVTQFNLLAGGLTNLLPWLETLVGLLIAKQGLSLLGAVKALAVGLPAFTSALTTAGIAMMAYMAADKVVDLVAALVAWKNANDNLQESQVQSVQVNKLSSDSLERFAQTTGIAVKSLDEAIQLHKDGVVVWDEASKSYKKAGEAMDGSGTAARNTADAFRKSEIAYQNSTAAIDKTTESSKKLAAGQKDVVTYTMQTVPVFDALTGKITGYEQRLVAAAGGAVALGGAAKGLNQDLSTSAGVMDALGQKTDLTNKELIDLAKVTKDAEGRLAELASNERIKFIEANVSLNIANLEANTKVATALIEGISSTITSTGDVLTGLFGQFGDFDKMGFSQQWKITEQIDKENKLRQDAFDLQKKATEAHIEMMRAQTNMLVNGDGLIKITGDGLKPHLEAIMWEVLEAVQVKVNKDGLKLLLGM